MSWYHREVVLKDTPQTGESGPFYGPSSVTRKTPIVAKLYGTERVSVKVTYQIENGYSGR
jgi:hypothetical protein